MKTNESFFCPRRLVFMGVDKPAVSADAADKAKPDYSNSKARSELLQQVDQKLAQLEKSDKPADREHASRLREAKDKAVLDMLGGVKEVEAANRLCAALTTKEAPKAPAKRAEVREARIDGDPITAAEVKEIVKTLGGNAVASRKGTPIRVDTSWLRFDDVSGLRDTLRDSGLASNIDKIGNLEAQMKNTGQSVALSQQLPGGAHVFARKVGDKVHYYLIGHSEKKA